MKRLAGGAALGLVGLLAVALPVNAGAAQSGTAPANAAPASAPIAGAPEAVTPYSGYNRSLTRAPYVTDLTQTSAYVNWATWSRTPGSIKITATINGACPSSTTRWTSSAKVVHTSLPGPVNPTSSVPTASMTGWAFTVYGAYAKIAQYQSSVYVNGLVPNSQYCYSVFSTDRPGARNLLPAGEPDQQFTTLAAVSTTSTTPLTFDVIADTGENYAYTNASTTSPLGDVAFPGGVNPDQAAIYHEIGQSGAKFLLIAGDIAYSGGDQSTYGDLSQTGTEPEVSNIFGPSYFPQTGGIPTFAADGNHGQNIVTLRAWPTSNTARNSGGTYAFDRYDNGINNISGTFPDDWYAFSTGNVRIYVLDGAWSDGTVLPLGNTTGSLCSTPVYCRGYQADADEHFQPTSPEYKWLARDLANHPGGIKFAVFHYPLRSDNATQPSDPYLQNSGANPHASTSLEALLSRNGVDIAFNGHAHTYQRFIPKSPGKVINYVSGGGGGVLAPVLGGISCEQQMTNSSVYALGWNPSKTAAFAGHGSYCGPASTAGPAAIAAATPTSAAQVYNFLKVTVTGDRVVVTPTNAEGRTFDQQTYLFHPKA